MQEGTGSRMDRLAYSQCSVLKNRGMDGDGAQLVEGVPHTHEALGSIPAPQKLCSRFSAARLHWHPLQGIGMRVRNLRP